MKRVLLPIFALALMFGWSCQSDELNNVSPAGDNGISLDAAMAAGGNGNGNAWGLLRNCASHAVLERQLRENPGLARKMEEIEEQARAFTNAKNGNGGGKPGGGGSTEPTPTPTYNTVTIPVKVHVIWDQAKPWQQISADQIQSQIDVMNRDFSGTNSDISYLPSDFQNVLAKNPQVVFSFNKTTDITYKSSTRAEWGTRDDMKYTSRGGVNAVDPTKYLNIWVCNIGGGILGYAQFPGGTLATDGVVVGPNFFGDQNSSLNVNKNSFALSSPYDLGRTATHEVGHWLNLRHIWGDGACSFDDGVTDTPSSDRANYGCPAYPTVHCRTTDMTMNYMDYTDDACMYMFSEGQKARMHALFASGGARSSIVQ